MFMENYIDKIATALENNFSSGNPDGRLVEACMYAVGMVSDLNHSKQV